MTKSDNATPVRIPAAKAGKLQTWQLPDIERSSSFSPLHALREQEIVRVVDEEVAAEKLTVKELDAIREEAYKEGFAEGRQDGFEQGKREGYEQGLAMGLNEGQGQIDIQLQVLQSIQSQLFDPLASKEEQLEALFYGLVVKLSEAIVMSELSISEDRLKSTLKQALDALPAQPKQLKIVMHPEDSQLLSEYAERHGLEFLDDVSMTRGGCRLISEHSEVDYQVETRFSQVLDQFKASLRMPLEPNLAE